MKEGDSMRVTFLCDSLVESKELCLGVAYRKVSRDEKIEMERGSERVVNRKERMDTEKKVNEDCVRE